MSTKPGATRLTRIGAISTARFSVSAGAAAVSAPISVRPMPRRRPPVPLMKTSEPPGRTLPVGEAGDAHRHHQVPLDVRPHLREVHLRERRVVRAAARDHHVVDLREVAEEALEAVAVGGVERRGADRPDLARGGLEALGVARGEDDVGALGAGAAGGLEADAGAAADDDDGLAGQLGLAHDEPPRRLARRSRRVSAFSASM